MNRRSTFVPFSPVEAINVIAARHALLNVDQIAAEEES